VGAAGSTASHSERCVRVFTHLHPVLTLNMREILQKVEERRGGEGNTLHKIKREKGNWIGHILHRNCLLKHVTQSKDRGKHRSDGNKWKKT
jgi:hypothetical protein